MNLLSEVRRFLLIARGIIFIIIIMSFQSKFKGKANLIGKEGTLETIGKIHKKEDSVVSVIAFNSGNPTENLKPHIAYSDNGEIIKYDELAINRKYVPPFNSQQSEKRKRIPSIPVFQKHSNLQMAGYNQVHHKESFSSIRPPDEPVSYRYHANPIDHSQASSRMKGYTPGSVKDYKKLKSEKYNMLGGLGANIGTLDWNEKINRKLDMLKFATIVKEYNKAKLASAPKRIDSKNELDTGRVKAMEYSRQLQKMVHSSVPVINHPLDVQKNIKELEDMNVRYSQKIEEMKGKH